MEKTLMDSSTTLVLIVATNHKAALKPKLNILAL